MLNNSDKNIIIKAYAVFKEEGVRGGIARTLRKTANIVDGSLYSGVSRKNKLIKFDSIVDRRDVMKFDWTDNVPADEYKEKNRNKCGVINWVISPPGATSGGHQNMFRFIEHLDKLGFKNNIYLYTTLEEMPIDIAMSNVSRYVTLNNTHFYQYDRDIELSDCDAIFATGWETAYPVLNYKNNARKFYFIQDFEPYFYPMGTEHILAENTYRFGFHGITAGNWLNKKLTNEYGMVCDSYDFGVNRNIYTYKNSKKRNEVFFYARPVTERRAFDLGIMALEIFHDKHPEYIINLAGWDVSNYDIPFPYINHKSLSIDELPELYNRCSVGLVLSLTNMSLLPLELLSCGVIPVVNDGDNNRQVSDNKYISYTHPSPVGLANAMSTVVGNESSAEYAKKASDSVRGASWDNAKDAFLRIVKDNI